MCDVFYFMANDRSNKALMWIAGAFVVLLTGGFAYKKYINMRMAGASGGDAFLFMIMVFVGILAVIGIAGGFHLFLYDSGRQKHPQRLENTEEERTCL